MRARRAQNILPSRKIAVRKLRKRTDAEKIIHGLIEMVKCGLTEIGTYDIIIVEIR